MQPGFGLVSEMTAIHRPKYHVFRDKAAKVYQCPHCHSFNLIERTGQVMTEEKESGFSVWSATTDRWFSCGDCYSNIEIDDANVLNRKKLTPEQSKALSKAKEQQGTITSIYDHLIATTAIHVVYPERLARYYAHIFGVKS